MARNLTPAMVTELSKGRVCPIVLVEIEFVSGTVNLWNGPQGWQILWNAKTWTGAGTLGSISAIEESTEIKATGLALSMSGIPSEQVATALTECRQGKPVRLWQGFLNLETGAVIADPYQSFAGRMDVPSLEDAPTSCVITLTAENNLIDLQRSPERRYTSEDQHIDYPDDKGFDQVPFLQNWTDADGKRVGDAGSPAPRLRRTTTW